MVKIPYRAPRANAICARFLESVRRECFDHLLTGGERQLYQVIKEYIEFFKQARPHQGVEQKIPERSSSVEEERRKGKIIAFAVLSGLHQNYRRVA